MRKLIQNRKRLWGVFSSVIMMFSLAFAGTPPAGSGYIVLGTDCNSPTPCSDDNADSLSITKAKVGETVYNAASTSEYWSWGFFGSSLTAPEGFYADFPTMCRWYSFDAGTSQSAADRVKYCPPNATYDYWVPSTARLTTPNDASVDTHYGVNHVYRFGGRSLTLAGGKITHCSKGTSICDFGDNVTIKETVSYNFPVVTCTTQPITRAKANIEGTLQFVADSGMNNWARKPTYLAWAVSGGADAVVELKHTATQNATWYWCGDSADFKGKIVMRGDSPTTDNYSVLVVSNAVIGGTVELQMREQMKLLGPNAYVAAADVKSMAKLLVAAGQTTKIGRLIVNGAVTYEAAGAKLFVGEGVVFGDSSQVVLGQASGAVMTIAADAEFSPAEFKAAAVRGGSTYDFLVELVDNGDGTKDVVVARAQGSRMINVTEDSSINSADDAFRVNVASGKTLDLVDNTGVRMAVNSDGAIINVKRETSAWQTLPFLWLDAAAKDSVQDVVVTYEGSRYNYNAGTDLKIGEAFCDVDGNPFVKGWFDCRSEQRNIKLWNARYDQVFNGHNTVMFGTNPRRVKGGFDGIRDYIACDRPTPNAHVVYANGSEADVAADPSNASRIYFTKYDSAATVECDSWQNPRYAFFVFGSQNGGGGALLGGHADFVRGGTAAQHQASDPIFASNAKGASVWLDGKAVDPTTTGFDGGWQVVTVDFKATSYLFSGLGYGSANNADNGGQNYAEVILIKDELTDRQRQEIEIYLAEKWGLKDKYNYPAWAKQFATVYGTGSVNLEADATLGGAFKGMIDLKGHDLVIDGVALPPTEDSVNTTGCVGWFDPDEVSTCETVRNDAKNPSTRLLWLYDRLGKADGRYALTGAQKERSPWIDESAHGFGLPRRWVDYSNGEISNGGADGNTLRFREMKDGEGTGDVVNCPFKTIIMVQDSKRGGGQPFVDGNSVLPDQSQVLYKGRIKKAADYAIYPQWTSDVLTGGKTYLDGREVDGLNTGFGGWPEVLSVLPKGDYAPVCFAHLQNSQNIASREDSFGEIQGEILMWNRALDDAERKEVEAYLSYKWIGLANEGYSDLTAATVTGAGNVSAADAALLPKFNAGFTGKVTVPLEDGLVFTLATVDGQTVVANAIDLGGGELAASGTVVVKIVKSGAKPKCGSYKLIGWASKPAETNWSLVMDGWDRDGVMLRATDDGLYLDVKKLGLILTIR